MAARRRGLHRGADRRADLRIERRRIERGIALGHHDAAAVDPGLVDDQDVVALQDRTVGAVIESLALLGRRGRPAREARRLAGGVDRRAQTSLCGSDDRCLRRRVQIVFDGPAPDVAFRSAGAGRVRREGRVLTVLSSAGAEGILEEARGLGSVAVDVVPVTLKEIFLETVAGEA